MTCSIHIRFDESQDILILLWVDTKYRPNYKRSTYKIPKEHLPEFIFARIYICPDVLLPDTKFARHLHFFCRFRQMKMSGKSTFGQMSSRAFIIRSSVSIVLAKIQPCTFLEKNDKSHNLRLYKFLNFFYFVKIPPLVLVKLLFSSLFQMMLLFSRAL